MGIINPATGRPFADTVHAAAPSSGERIRLLACGKCKTVEVLDDYKGPRELAAEYDVVLNIAVEGHQEGVERIPHAPARLFDVAKEDWDNPPAREQIISQIRMSIDPNAETGLGAEAYALRDNFRADAMSCWEKHLRTPDCSDYKSPEKRLVPETQRERRELGAAAYDANNPELTRYLCEYCPVHSLVIQKKRKDAGLYDR